jgi:hypothetical protein
LKMFYSSFTTKNRYNRFINIHCIFYFHILALVFARNFMIFFSIVLVGDFCVLNNEYTILCLGA